MEWPHPQQQQAQQPSSWAAYEGAGYYTTGQPPQPPPQQPPDVTRPLSLNMSSLSVASPANVSPISPSNSFPNNYLPRKQSFNSNTSTTGTLVEETYEEHDGMDVADDSPNADGSTPSPVDGEASVHTPSGAAQQPGNQPPFASGKPVSVNNFVHKLYQMISDQKSAHFISWNELGTSFVVSNVGEFSRTILGSHFKHNNFSSFVRQLNMYGFHKINRTPRAQRQTSDSQTWEFSHHKFLRGRPDLLDEIKRKALEAENASMGGSTAAGNKWRVELPGEVQNQLNTMREENLKMWDMVLAERKRSEKLVSTLSRLWDVVGNMFPGSLPNFPQDLMEPMENPNIFVQPPTGSSMQPPPPHRLSLSSSNQSLHSASLAMSPAESPTTAEFSSPNPASQYHPPTFGHHHAIHHQPHSQTLSRQHSFQHLAFSSSSVSASSSSRDSMSIPPSPHDEQQVRSPTAKRQRTESQDDLNPGTNSVTSPTATSTATATSFGGHSPSAPSFNLPSGSGGNGGAGGGAPKRLSRARSDSAPLGHGHYAGTLAPASWNPQQQAGAPMSTPGMLPPSANRPRSGSGVHTYPHPHHYGQHGAHGHAHGSAGMPRRMTASGVGLHPPPVPGGQGPPLILTIPGNAPPNPGQPPEM